MGITPESLQLIFREKLDAQFKILIHGSLQVSTIYQLEVKSRYSE
jgi:hypothetical protein